MYACNTCIKLDVCRYKDSFLEIIEEIEAKDIEEPFKIELRCKKWISCDIERNTQMTSRWLNGIKGHH